jgi:hypothetical protein
LLLCAVFLRFAGLDWGVPGQHHFISLHPDEFRLVDPVARSLASGEVSPETYNYGSLPFDLLWMVARLSSAWGHLPTHAELILIGRTWTALFGSGTVALVFLLGRRIAGARVGLLAAALLAFAPGHVQHSHFATVDVPAAFFVTLALWLAARAGETSGAALLAGAAAGLAAATKYPAGWVLLVVIFMVGWSAEPQRHGLGRVRLRSVALACLAALAAFLCAIPYLFGEWAVFREALAYELLEHPTAGHGQEFAGTGNGLLYLLSVNLPWAFTWPATLSAGAGLVSLARASRRSRALLIFLLPFVLALSLSNVRFMRYSLILLPSLAVGAALFVERLRLASPGRRALVAVLLAPAALGSGLLVNTLLRPDPRWRAQDWIAANIPQGESIGLSAVPHFQLPNLVARGKSRDLDTSPAAARRRFLAQVKGRRTQWEFTVCSDWNVTKLESQAPRWFVTSELDWLGSERRRAPEYLRFMEALDGGWELVASFESLPRAWRWIFGSASTPHDALYSFPEVRVYRRR